MDDESNTISFNIDPFKTPKLYAEAYLIQSDKNMVTFNFAQAAPDPSQQQVVARISMTPAQAREFLEKLNDHIEKFEV